jgi:type 1 glutamine amidotransferase
MKIMMSLKFWIGVLSIAFALMLLGAKPDFLSSEKKSNPRVLIFSKTNGYRHSSIPVGIAAIKKLGAEKGFDVDATEDSTAFTTDNLKKYAALIFLSTTGTVFGPDQEKALQDYIQHGGGFVGIHAAADCEYKWPWYGQLVGAYFKSHPKQQQAKLMIVNKNHPSTKSLPDTWERFDEWYNYRDRDPKVTVLIKLDEHSYTGGENGDDHPITWYHEFDGGRAFYTGLGHTDESYADPKYLEHILGGIEWTMEKTK